VIGLPTYASQHVFTVTNIRKMKNQCLANFGKTTYKCCVPNGVGVRRRKDSFPSRDKEQPSGLTEKAGTLLTAGMWHLYW
jgi:hypothetical protein